MGYNIGAGNKVQAADLEQVYRAAGPYAADAGGSDAYVITVVPAPASLNAGMVFHFKANTANTGAATLNVNGAGAISIVRADGSALADGDIAAGQFVAVIYDGTNFRLLSPVANAPKYTHGVTTRDLSTASGSQTIAHGLGRPPRKARLTVMFNLGGTNYGMNISIGTWNGSTVAGISHNFNNASNSQNTSTSDIIVIYSAVTGGYQTATITADATNITLAWTKIGSPTGTANIHWETEA